jgi:D-alanyl-lipoteichoic acid acyltransferase DltB (MBOAT superfamily)
VLFNSAQFLFFFIAVYLLYVISPFRAQNWLLLGASYIFYGAWDYRFLSLILISTLVDYFAALAIDKARQDNAPRRAKLYLLVSITTNLCILGFFKYFNFFVENFQALLALFGFEVSSFTLYIILPVGISFYTFQTMSYSIDVYRGRQKPVRYFPDFALYVSFFPQLMAGPIERAGHLLPQLTSPRKITALHLQQGGWLILWGVFKKVYIADNLAPYTQWAFQLQGAATTTDIYIAIFAFSIQVYCDFSGYSDIARGVARMMGITLNRNFYLPFWASNPAQFWQRWHITLSNWFKDYVYEPLSHALHPSTALLRRFPRWLVAGTWHGATTIPVMMLVGLWHGAGWKYIVFGLLWGIVLSIYGYLRPFLYTINKSQQLLRIALTAGGIVLTHYIWLVLLIMFIAVDINHAFQLWAILFTDFQSSAYSARDAVSVLYYALPLIIMQSIQFAHDREDVVSILPVLWRILLYTILLALLLINGSEHMTEFIYFQF